MGQGHPVLFSLKRYVFSLYCWTAAAIALALHLSLSYPVGVTDAGSLRVVNEMLDVSSDLYAFNGPRRYHAESARISHSPEDGTVSFQQLTMQYYSAAGALVLSLSSDSATGSHEGRVLRLAGEVELLRFGDDGLVQESFTAPTLEIKTDLQVAQTQDEVLVRRGGGVTRGRGMIVDLEKGTVELLEGARSSHAM